MPNDLGRSSPIYTQSLSRPYVLALVTAALMATASLAGIFFQSALYPTPEVRQSFVPNDVVNLVLAIPVLIGSTWLARRGASVALLALPGALFYVLYNYVAYVVALALTPFTLLPLALVVLSASTMVWIVASLDANIVRQGLQGTAPVRSGAGVLIGFGALFLLRAVGVLLNSPATADLAVAFADLATTPVWIMGGVMLWRRHALGYGVGLGLLFQASLLFTGLVILLLIQPLLTSKPFDPAGVVLVLVMGLICFVPCGLYARAASRGTRGKGAAVDNRGLPVDSLERR